VARYTQDSIERLRETVDAVELISERTDLRQRGSRWVGLCPFHEERTPSFTVDPSRGLYHCFGCQAGGDSITFLRETQGLEFSEAVEALAERYRVELKREQEDPREEERRRRRERLLALLDRTTTFYAKFLWDSDEAAPARSHLAERGLSEEVLRDFRVGYAPGGWDRLVVGAGRDGFTAAELEGAGLAQRGKRGGHIDRFRERITFPLADARGRVLGFGARALRDDQGAKYINTAEGEIYHKGRALFGIDRARAPIAKAGRAVVVEGYTDVLALHQAGVAETVAIMGTALTREQLGELARAVGADGTVVLALDADRSGQEAMLRAAGLAAEREVELRVVELPEGGDPAELVAAEGEAGIRQRLESSLSVLRFSVGRVLVDADLETPEGRDRALVRAQALIAEAPPRSARRDDLVRLVADRLDLPLEWVAQEGSTRPKSTAPAAEPAPARAPAPAPPPTTPGAQMALESERHFLALCLGAGPRGREYLARLRPSHFSSDLTRRAAERLGETFDDPLADLPEGDAELRAAVAEVALRADTEDPAGEGVLGMSFLGLEQRRIEREIRHARADGDLTRQGELAAERQRVRRDMDTVMGQAT
jgi:DNA primase